jgi:hypothetical protein
MTGVRGLREHQATQYSSNILDFPLPIFMDPYRCQET